MQFVKNFIVDNPLCVCSEEISNIKKRVLQENDEIRLKQKTSQVVIKLKQDAYYLNARLTVPNDYPLERTGSVQVDDCCFVRTNLRTDLFFVGKKVCVQSRLVITR